MSYQCLTWAAAAGGVWPSFHWVERIKQVSYRLERETERNKEKQRETKREKKTKQDGGHERVMDVASAIGLNTTVVEYSKQPTHLAPQNFLLSSC